MLNPETIKILEQVCEKITTHSAQFDMTSWFQRKDGAPENPLHDCGTAACIAGWALALKYPEGAPTESIPVYNCGGILAACSFEPVAGEVQDVYRLVQQTLELDEVQCDSLFYPVNWPHDLYLNYSRAESPQEEAEIACRRIRRFIRSGGEE